MNKKFWFLILMFLIFLTACEKGSPANDQPEEISTASNKPTDESGYPIEESREKSTEEGYPISEEVVPEYTQGPKFTIDQPVLGGDTVITGSGPAGVPIKLIDVSEVGLLLGETVIDKDGSFTINLQKPLKSNHTIGLQVGNLEGTEYTEEDFLFSPTYYERPLVGILVDMVVVK